MLECPDHGNLLLTIFDAVLMSFLLHTNLYLNMRCSLYVVKAVSPMDCLLTDSSWIARLDGNMRAGSSFVIVELALRVRVTTLLKNDPSE